MKIIILSIFLFIIFPLSVFGSMPAFPMAFYGNVTINNSKAPEGTIVRAYYGNILAGESTVDNLGSYGYISSIAKKLLVAEGSGLITFTFQSPSHLSNKESGGRNTILYPSFEGGSVVNKNLAFSYSTGGGGGGSVSVVSKNETTVLVSETPLVSIDQAVEGCMPGYLFSPINAKPCPIVINPVSPTLKSIPGCDNRKTGFSITTGQSCIGNIVSNTTLSSQSKVYNFGTMILKNGSKGESVKELQKYLNDTLNLGLIVDGILGPKTIAVIKQWQKEHGLVPDGLVGPKTKAMMNSLVYQP